MTQEKALTILKTGKNVFLTGEPGSGKSYTINLFKEYLKSQGITYAVTASTGIAATHIGGITIHSWSGIGVKEEIDNTDIYNISENKFACERIENTDVLIIDEVSMLSAQMIDNIDKVLTGIRNFMSNDPFGNMQIVFVGDFFQLPPISKNPKKPAQFAFESEAWLRADPVVCYLHENHRQGSDKKFEKILTAIRQRQITETQRKQLLKQNKADQTITRLYTHNEDVDRINTKKLAEIQEKAWDYLMTSEGIPFLVETLKRSCLSPERLTLKVGAIVMFTKNLFVEGVPIYVNGTLGKVIGYENGRPVVETNDGRKITVDRAEWAIIENNFKKASITQYPLRLAWAITVHKSQGMSLDAAAIDLTQAFEYGQGYVALSRVRSLSGLYLKGMNPKALEVHPKVVEQDLEFHEKSDLVDEQF